MASSISHLWGGGLFAVTPESAVQWIFPLSVVPQFVFQISSPAIGPDGTIYVGAADHKVYAVSPEGKQRWAYKTGDSISSSPSVADDGTVLIGSDDGKLYALSFDGQKKWEFNAGRIIESSCAIASDGTVYVGSLDDNLYALTRNGRLIWTVNLTNAISASPLISSEGAIWVNTIDGTVTKIHRDGSNLGHYAFASLLFSSAAFSTQPGPCGYFAAGSFLYRRAATSGLASSGWPMFRRNPSHTARSDQRGLSVTGFQNSAINLALTVETNRTYSLEQSSNLQNWNMVQGLKPLQPNVRVTVPQTNDQSFYRLKLE